MHNMQEKCKGMLERGLWGKYLGECLVAYEQCCYILCTSQQLTAEATSDPAQLYSLGD